MLFSGDACIKIAIKEVVELPINGSIENPVQSIIFGLTSLLIAAPDPPDASSPLFLFQGLINAIQSCNIDQYIQIQLYIAIVKALSAASQDVLPYHFFEGI